MTESFRPMSVSSIDVAEGIPPVIHRIDGRPRLRVLVRMLRRPVGFVEFDVPELGLPAAQFIGLVEAELGDAIAKELQAHGADDRSVPDIATALAETPRPFESSALPAVSVVISTRDRAESLQRCLDALVATNFADFEVLVVDNAPKTDATKTLLETRYAHDPRFRYLFEPTPGLSHGRNCGLRAARHDIVAYTDDDTEADPWWVAAIATTFAAHPDAGCVTGLVPTAEIDTLPQQHFDRRVSWSSNCSAQRYTLDMASPPNRAFPFASGVFGTGANFAVRRQMMLDLGEFDTLLGAGAPTMGGEDLDAFVRVVLDGHALVYEPAAIVWHHHRVAPEALKRQLYGYGLGLSAYITKLLTNPRTVGKVLRKVPSGVTIFTKARKDDHADDVPVDLGITETLGFLAGPFVYLKCRIERRIRLLLK